VKPSPGFVCLPMSLLLPGGKLISLGRVLLSLSLIALCAEAAVSETATPASVSYSVKRASGAITVDGRLDEADWTACEPIKLVGYNQGIVPKQETVARILWDDTCLYLSWYCRDTQVWSTLTTRDDTLYEQEVVEVFINPDGDRETYLELEVNPLGALWDGFIVTSGKRRYGILAWNSFKLRRGVWIEGTVNDESDRDGFWSVELAVPLEELDTAAHIPPQAGDRWRLNLYRIDLPDRDKTKADYSAWSPVSGESYHDPDRFGEIVFSAESAR